MVPSCVVNRLQAQLACQIRAGRQPLPLRPRSHSERSFIGGGYRTTRSTAALPTRSGTAGPVAAPPLYPAPLPFDPSKILDVEAVSVAGCGGGATSTESNAHSRNRFARMSSDEVERFSRSWNSRNYPRKGSTKDSCSLSNDLRNGAPKGSWSSRTDFRNGSTKGSWSSRNNRRNGSPEGGGAAGLDVGLRVFGVNADGGDGTLTVAAAATASGGSEVRGDGKAVVMVPGGLLLPPGVGCSLRGGSLLDEHGR